MKKGFTLIELLSVIVVLAIISVIAIPTLIGVVNKVKLQSLRSSAYGLIEAGTLYNAQYGNANNARFDIMNNVVTTTESNKIKYKGSVKQGTVIVSTKGKVSVCVTDGKNSAYKNYNDTEVTLVSKKTCSVPANTAVIYLDGEATMDANDAKAILDAIDDIKSENNILKSSINELKAAINELKNNSNSGYPILNYAKPLHTFSSGNLTYTATKECYVVGYLGLKYPSYPNSSYNKLTINNNVVAGTGGVNSSPVSNYITGSSNGGNVSLLRVKAGDVLKVTEASPDLHVFEEVK